MNDYPDIVWITPQADGATPFLTNWAREGAREYIRGDISRDAIAILTAIMEGYGVDRQQLLAALKQAEKVLK